MKISELYGKGRVVYSFEVFPPKKDSPVETIYQTLDSLYSLKPDYISVTYGAGGNPANKSTAEISGYIKNKLGIEAMAHLTCINSNKDTIDTVLADLKEHRIENILALRGDLSPGVVPQNDFHSAKDLVNYIKNHDKNMSISGACYPEGHPMADNIIDDIRHLKEKTDAGAQTLVTQLVFDNERFYRFLGMTRAAGINTPISVGIMPVTNKKQIERMVTMCAVSLPPKFVKIMSRYENNPQALTDAGIAYAIEQIVDLIANGAEGIHLYTMNRPYVAEKITEAVRSLL